MKILILEEKTNKLANILSEYYEIILIKLDELLKNKTLEEQKDIINNINKENKSYILETSINNIEFIYNLVDTILLLEIKNIEKYLNILKKHPKKTIILKNKREINKYLKAIYKNDNYLE